MSQEPIKVAVLGGGIAGLSAAYELTRTDELRERYRVTVYTQGWRLGGKGASGRYGWSARIHEHGLHVWFGFYVNALALMDECLRERRAIRPPWVHNDLSEAFLPLDELVLVRGSDHVCLPLPSKDVGQPFFAHLPIFIALLLRDLAMAIVGAGNLAGPAGTALADAEAQALNATPLDESLDQQALLPSIYASVAAELEKAAVALVPAAPAAAPSAVKTCRELFFFWSAVLGGLAADVLPGLVSLPGKQRPAKHPFDQLNDVDLRVWLENHGRIKEFRDAPFLCSLYDLVFAYKSGKVGSGEMAAGVALENILSIVGRNGGSMMMKMSGAMGDVIFAPLFEVLRARGVSFHFFHAVTRLHLDEAGDNVGRIDLVRQGELAATTYRSAGGRYTQVGPGYKPLEDYGDIAPGLRGWPAEPRESELSKATNDKLQKLKSRLLPADFEREADPIRGARETLAAGTDFDQVVLAIPVAALGWTAAEHPPGWPGEPAAGSAYAGPCQELMTRWEPFRNMVLESGPVMTQAFQLWLDRDRADVGWPCKRSRLTNPGGRRVEAILGNAPHDFETMCDMSHLLDLERWGWAGAPRQLAYFCGVLDEDTVTGTWREADLLARDNAQRWLEQHCAPPVKPFWRDLRPSDLHDIGGPPDWRRLDAQHWRANTGRSERYSAPFIAAVGTRLAPGRSGFQNLKLAGDWTRTQVNAGCVEAAVMSGMLAAAAICGPAGRLPQLPSWRSGWGSP